MAQEYSNITKYTILGERCSGTNYLKNMIESNFYLKSTPFYKPHKHFYAFHEYTHSPDTLHILIYRDAYEWINSLRKNPWCIPDELKKSDNAFLNNEFYSVETNNGEFGVANGSEILIDRNPFTKARYHNIFMMRQVKIKFALDVISRKVKNFIAIKYEDLRDNHVKVLNQICDKFNLKTKPRFPHKILFYKNKTYLKFKKDTKYVIPKSAIIKHLNYDRRFEESLGYPVD